MKSLPYFLAYILFLATFAVIVMLSAGVIPATGLGTTWLLTGGIVLGIGYFVVETKLVLRPKAPVTRQALRNQALLHKALIGTTLLIMAGFIIYAVLGL